MIFTSYFAKTKKFPENFIPVSISQWPPKDYNGLECKALAPTKEILLTYKESNEDDKIKEEKYISSYKKEVLNKVDFKQLLLILQNSLDKDILDFMDTENIWESNTLHLVFTCFEKSETFCHRNIVSEEMRNQNIPCKELDDMDLVKLGLQLNFNIER